jgi:ribosomal protein S12 methylthiotransferase accessory factor
VSPIAGIVGSLDPAPTGAGDLMHVWTADFLFPPQARVPGAIRTAVRRISTGKGATAIDARAGALSESLERYSGVFRGDEPRRRARVDRLGDAAIDPGACMNFSPRQYRQRADWNADGFPMTHVPVPFDPRRPIEWTPVRSLTGHREKLVPTACCYYGYRGPGHYPFTRADSNGVAAGPTLEHAIVAGFLELVERDAVAIWWYNRLGRPAVDLASVSDPVLAPLVSHYRRIGREVRVFDITTDLEVPAFAAISGPLSGGGVGLTYGFGADFDPVTAIRRAVLEMSQFLPEVAAGRVRRSLSRPLRRASFLDPSRKPPRAFDRASSPCGAVTVARCLRVAAARGLEVLVLDQTRRDVGLPVARVIVPGLRHFWPRWGPGRLYTVPVAMGWLTAPRAEEELNPSAFLI